MSAPSNNGEAESTLNAEDYQLYSTRDTPQLEDLEYQELQAPEPIFSNDRAHVEPIFSNDRAHVNLISNNPASSSQQPDLDLRLSYLARMQEFLDTLPKIPLFDLTQDNECIICKDEYSGGFSFEDPVRLPCNHVVGDACIKTWFENGARQPGGKATCPMCREVFFVMGSRVRARVMDLTEETSTVNYDEETATVLDDLEGDEVDTETYAQGVMQERRNATSSAPVSMEEIRRLSRQGAALAEEAGRRWRNLEAEVQRTFPDVERREQSSFDVGAVTEEIESHWREFDALVQQTFPDGERGGGSSFQLGAAANDEAHPERIW